MLGRVFCNRAGPGGGPVLPCFFHHGPQRRADDIGKRLLSQTGGSAYPPTPLLLLQLLQRTVSSVSMRPKDHLRKRIIGRLLLNTVYSRLEVLILASDCFLKVVPHLATCICIYVFVSQNELFKKKNGGIFQTGCPMPAHWRWGSIGASLERITALSNVLPLIWDAKKFAQSSGSAISKDENLDDEDQASLNLPVLSKSIKSAKWWGCSHMMLQAKSTITFKKAHRQLNS